MQLLKKAFTRTELLIVVAITCLLMVFFLSVWSKARFRARVALCTTNLHQWAGVLKMYADQNEQRLPSHEIAGGGVNASDIAIATKQALEEYGAKGLWMCPAAPSEVIQSINNYSVAGMTPNKDLQGFYVIPGYFLWVPRRVKEVNPGLVPLRDVFPEKDMITGKPFCGKVDDDSAKVLPVMTDIVFKQTPVIARFASPDLSDGAPVDLRWESVVWKGVLDGVYALHVANGKVVNVNWLFTDGRVETHPAAEVRTRYMGSYQNLF
jgi:hypothetical protein